MPGSGINGLDYRFRHPGENREPVEKTGDVKMGPGFCRGDGVANLGSYRFSVETLVTGGWSYRRLGSAASGCAGQVEMLWQPMAVLAAASRKSSSGIEVKQRRRADLATGVEPLAVGTPAQGLGLG